MIITIESVTWLGGFYVIGNFVPYDIKTLSYTMLHWSIVTHA